MKIIRFQNEQNDICYGARQKDGSTLSLQGSLFDGFELTSDRVEVRKLLAPIVPSSILCVGLNYHYHARECGMELPEFPVLFMKAINAVQNPDDPILIPTYLTSQEVDYECELAVIIGKTCKNISRKNALDYVLGYTCANDVSARDWQIQKGGSQWCRGKTFDTFAPLGPCIVTSDELSKPNELQIKTILNGEVVQDWNTKDMIFDVPALIEFLSGSTTLLPGTVIMTGTPHGVGMGKNPPRWLKSGDTVTIDIEQIGSLTNPVMDEKEER
ncbi:MAG: fumarylacetoacetate hydrolase family protein [Verrucomicrobia bacterium]|nr:fumarylacetoacetate hydrolase family protein [Verrucomicrobiota bacterium]